MVAALVAAYDTSDFGRPDELGLAFLRSGWAATDWGREPGAWIVHDPGGGIAGYATTDEEFVAHGVVEAFGRVHPRRFRTGVGSALLELTERLARRHVRPSASGEVLLRHDISGSDDGAQRLLVGAGYSFERRFLHMEIDLDGAPESARAIPGVSFDRADLPGDEKALYALHEAAFSDEWDYLPASFEDWAAGSTRTPESDPGLWFVAKEGDELIGFLWARLWGDIAYVNDIAVAQSGRGWGIGGSLIRRAFAEFHRRGFTQVMLNVDADNPNGAVELYRRAGMRVRRSWDVYAKCLRP